MTMNEVGKSSIAYNSQPRANLYNAYDFNGNNILCNFVSLDECFMRCLSVQNHKEIGRLYTSSKYGDLIGQEKGLFPRSTIPHGEHPLSLGKTSVWNQFFQDGRPPSVDVHFLIIHDRKSLCLETYLDLTFMSIIKDPNQRRQKQWEKTARAQNEFNFAKLLGFGDLGVATLSVAEEYSLHH
ncbi:protein GDAP2 [Tanacetum coccineum]